MLLLDVGLPPRNAAERARHFEHGELAVQPGAEPFPWRDNPRVVHADTGGSS
ncbi:hypothetical protein NOGI109294_15895 [Nocardiopsis gilva]|uniref:hypothetical protein n=1 Tax=Nocardiopsis gilva TaxID=280236 RepID=UPI00036A2637|nr:hypothetical protein [Nocardiopsis gilva]